MSGNTPKNDQFTRESVPTGGPAKSNVHYPQEIIAQVDQCITEGIGKLAPLREQWNEAQGVDMQTQWAYQSVLALLEAFHLSMQYIKNQDFSVEPGASVAGARTLVGAGGHTPRRT